MGDYSANDFVPEPELSGQRAFTKRQHSRKAFIDYTLMNKSGSNIADPNTELDHPHPFTTFIDDPIVRQKLSESQRVNAPPQHVDA